MTETIDVIWEALWDSEKVRFLVLNDPAALVWLQTVSAFGFSGKYMQHESALQTAGLHM
jgi:O-glycosyl hydrolase